MKFGATAAYILKKVGGNLAVKVIPSTLVKRGTIVIHIHQEDYDALDSTVLAKYSTREKLMMHLSEGVVILNSMEAMVKSVRLYQELRRKGVLATMERIFILPPEPTKPKEGGGGGGGDGGGDGKSCCKLNYELLKVIDEKLDALNKMAFSQRTSKKEASSSSSDEED